MKQNESGRSLIEMLAVIGIIGVLSVGVVSGIRWGLVGGGSFKLQSEIESMAQQVQDLCAWEGLEDCTIMEGDIELPTGWSIVTSGDYETQYIQVPNVKQRICRRFVNPFYVNWTQGTIERIQVGEGTVADVPISSTSWWRNACPKSENTMRFYIKP